MQGKRTGKVSQGRLGRPGADAAPISPSRPAGGVPMHITQKAIFGPLNATHEPPRALSSKLATAMDPGQCAKLCNLVFQKLEEYAISRHSNVITVCE